MEIILLGFFYVIYVLVEVYTTDHDTKSDKDRSRFSKGIAYFDNKQFDDAFVYFDTAVKQSPKSAIALGYMGLCHLQTKNYHSALYDLTQALSYDYSIFDFQIGKGRAYYALEDWQEAFVMFNKAVWYARKRNAVVYSWRGKTYIQLQKNEEAIKDFEMAIALGDEDAVYLLQQCATH